MKTTTIFAHSHLRRGERVVGTAVLGMRPRMSHSDYHNGGNYSKYALKSKGESPNIAHMLRCGHPPTRSVVYPNTPTLAGRPRLAFEPFRTFLVAGHGR